jgi:hypothetical protein
MRLRNSVGFAAGLIGVMTFVGPAFAASLSEQFSTCVAKFANDHQSVSVMLECNAADGKLSDCKVTDAPSPANGFDKAALCVADILPIGSKTGTIKVPIRFQSAS